LRMMAVAILLLLCQFQSHPKHHGSTQEQTTNPMISASERRSLPEDIGQAFRDGKGKEDSFSGTRSCSLPLCDRESWPSSDSISGR
jgi:hypothetical protein